GRHAGRRRHRVRQGSAREARRGGRARERVLHAELDTVVVRRAARAGARGSAAHDRPAQRALTVARGDAAHILAQGCEAARVEISVQVEAAAGTPAPVEYRWDTDTAILTAHVAQAADGKGMSGSVELAGNDGSWLILDMHGGGIRGVEIAVWPDVQKQNGL